MNSQKKMVAIQRIFNPNQYRSNGLAVLNKENFARIMIESVNKAINSNESPVKEKHVRKLLIGSYQAESGLFFWQYLPVIRLKENQIVCWKFCHVLHKMLRDGHKQVLISSYERKQILIDCGNMWRHIEDGYGQLIYKYCTLLYNRINFLVRNNRFPNDLKVADEQLDEIGERDSSVFFDLSCEIFDALDDILRLQELVFVTLDVKKYHSMTNTGQCHLAPLLACIQDSSLLYDYSVKILFKLHSNLPASTLEGHRDRFKCQHKGLKKFYVDASNLQYFKTLIQIPHLSERAPNFLNATDLQQHVTPKVVLIEGSSAERDSPESQVNLQQLNNNNNSELLVNINEDQLDELESSSTSQSLAYTSNDGSSSIDAMLNAPHTSMQEQPSIESSMLQSANEELKDKIMALELEIVELKSQLELERIDHTSTKERLEVKIREMEQSIKDQIDQREADMKKMKRDLDDSKCERNRLNTALEHSREECKKAEHDNMISQEAMKKLVKDLSTMKGEIATLRLASNKVESTIDDKKRNEADEELIIELNKKVNELSLQLSERNNQSQEWDKERQNLMSAKEQLEKKLDNHEEDLLIAEMNETDKIIKEATRKIEELSEKSRQVETGVKLQVNEKISEVCSNLMKAVRNLIIQSRLLQREVVGSVPCANSNDFYKRNSTWTEGLISAANVVAMAARSLVDSADRTMSGKGKFSELAAAAHEVAAATTQLVVASRVKANKDSEKLKILTSAAKQVTQCTGNIVDTARVCADLIEQEIDKVDISTLSLHQTKKLEMETQVKILELEDKLTKERVKLGELRKKHYEEEENELNSANSEVANK